MKKSKSSDFPKSKFDRHKDDSDDEEEADKEE
jgi:hypothetical protein